MGFSFNASEGRDAAGSCLWFGALDPAPSPTHPPRSGVAAQRSSAAWLKARRFSQLI